jgi:putative hydrolase of the HAD superfamily
VISVVLFDLDDTLFAHRRATEAGVVAHLRASGFEDDATTATRWSALEKTHYDRYLDGELDYVGQRRARARGFMEAYGVTFESDADAEAWFDGYAQSYRAAWTLHEDALPTLAALSAYRLGIVTNGVTEQQQRKLDRLGLTPLFSHVVTSADFGAVKPDPSIFLHAVSLFGVSPADAVYVGDRLRTDALGATRAASVPVIHSLAELPPLLPAFRNS